MLDNFPHLFDSEKGTVVSDILFPFDPLHTLGQRPRAGYAIHCSQDTKDMTPILARKVGAAAISSL